MSLTRWILVTIVHLLILNGWVTCRECNSGEYAPDPYDCNGFLQCHFGRWIQRNCPRDLHFNRANFVCDFAWNANCLIYETTSTTTTPDDPPTPPPTDPTGTHSPSPTTTSTTTPSPTTSTTTTSTTTSTTTISPTKTTMLPTNPPTSPTTISPTTTTMLPTNPPILECTPTDGLYVLHLPHPNCSMFYKCVHGIPHEMLCPFTQHWATNLDRCDSPSDANCIDGAAREQLNARPPNYW